MSHDPSHPGDEIDALANDWERSDHCERLAAYYRNLWFVGQRQEIDYVVERARLGDFRFKKMNRAQKEATGRQRWARSADARDFVEGEQMYTRWALLYAARASLVQAGPDR